MSETEQKCDVVILGIFVADLAFSARRLPLVGETISGSDFAMGPGGKGANQAVASARGGAKTAFISRLGKDDFGELALATWAREGVVTRVSQSQNDPTGAAFIFVNDQTGDNAIIVVPGAAAKITAQTVEDNTRIIQQAKVFVTQLEQPVEAALRGLQIARASNTITVFNPAPAEDFPDEIYSLCDYITPNETEAAALAGMEVSNIDDARSAGDALLDRGVGTALITLGEAGALFHNRHTSELIPAISVARVIDTTGAGDAFNGNFAAALARGMDATKAVHFANAAAGISVTRSGTAPAMPTLEETRNRLSST
ncbi:MAG TPA: ribokinase [Devosia sp.]|nr:ribokinase [Devosia sp.]